MRKNGNAPPGLNSLLARERAYLQARRYDASLFFVIPNPLQPVRDLLFADHGNLIV